MAGYYTFSDTYMQSTKIAEVEDLNRTLAESMDQFDYLLVYNDDPVFETALKVFMETYEGNTQVVRVY